jgi:hypothetical protein
MNRRVVEEDGVVVEERPRRQGGLIRLIVSLIVVAVLAAVVLVVVINATSSKSAKDDVTITSCRGPAGSGKPTAAGRVLNHSSKTSTYAIRLKFTDAQHNTVSEGFAPVQSVDSKKTATWEITGVRSVNGSVQCTITGVSRINLPGQ